MPEYSFILITEVKQRFLYLNNRIRQRSERRQALADAITFGVTMEPYLRLTVRRQSVVRDALDSVIFFMLKKLHFFLEIGGGTCI